MRNRWLILLTTFGLLACSGKRLRVGEVDGGGGGGHAGSGGAAGASAGGASGQTGGGGRGGTIVSGVGGNAVGGTTAGGTTGAGGTGGSAGTGTIGAGGAAGQAGSGGAAGASALSVDPASATFASTLVEAVSAAQTFTVRNGGSATIGTATALAATFGGTNAVDFLITSNGCGATLQPGASCEIAVAFAPKTRSGSRSASLAVTAAAGALASVSLSGTALPSLGYLAGGVGGPGNLDGTGAAAHFGRPTGIVGDGAGNLYVADNNLIRKVVIATGAVTTFLNGGVDAHFSGITSDGAGNLYVTDGPAIRKVVIATGAVTTFADGNGATGNFVGICGIAGDGAGNLYITTDFYDGTIRKVVIATGAVTTLAGTEGTFGSADGTGADARFGGPCGIAGDGAGNLYVADNMNNTIRKIVIATGAVTTFAGAVGVRGGWDGTGIAASFNGPTGIASDGAGNLYVADTGGNTVRKIVIATAAVTTLAGATTAFGSADGTGAAARFYYPFSIATDGAGNVYVGETGNATIRKVVVATGAVTTLAGAVQQFGSTDGTRTAARFNVPDCIASDGAGNLYVADTRNYTIRKVVVATGAVTTLAGAAGQVGSADGTGAAARFYEPRDVVSDGAGNLYVLDSNNSTIRKVVIATGVVTTLAGAAGQHGSADGTGAAARFYQPTGLANDGAGNLYVGEGINRLIRKVVIATRAVTTLAGTVGQDGIADGIGAAARFSSPDAVASDGAGNLFVADSGTIRKIVLATRAVTTFAGAAYQVGTADGTGAAARFNGPYGLASDGAGTLYVADSRTIRKIAIATATVSTLVGSPARFGVLLGALPASLGASGGLAVLPTGELAIVDGAEGAILIGHL